MLIDKELLGYLSLLLTLVSNAPYIRSVWRGTTKPHVFTLLLWALVAGIAASAQHSANAGPGAWAAGLTAICSAAVVLLCFRQKADWSITRGDWIAFIGALAIIPIWMVTKSALIAAILATLIDALAYIPSFRKFYFKPYEEMAFLYVVANLKHLAAIAATTEYSLTTLVFPVCILIMNSGMIMMLLIRRKAVSYNL